jgi:hypothetical protein
MQAGESRARQILRATLIRDLFVLAIIAPPGQAPAVRSTVNMLPACVGKRLTNQLHGIAVTNAPILGPELSGIATPDGVVVVVNSPDVSLTLVLLHELGHEVDYDIGASTTARFRRALARDFEGLSAVQRRTLSAYRDPAEAFAELFAERYSPGNLYEQEGTPAIDRLTRTHRLVNRMLTQLERCEIESPVTR